MDLDDEEFKETRKKLDKYVEKEQLRKILKEYAKTDLQDYNKIIEFYQKLKKLVEV